MYVIAWSFIVVGLVALLLGAALWDVNSPGRWDDASTTLTIAGGVLIVAGFAFLVMS